MFDTVINSVHSYTKHAPQYDIRTTKEIILFFSVFKYNNVILLFHIPAVIL